MARAEHHVIVGVLALQGAFKEHLQLLRQAFSALEEDSKQVNEGNKISWECIAVRNSNTLAMCNALIIPGGESTTIANIATRSGLLEPLRKFVKVERKPVWGTCAGMILLSEAANNTKTGGQELIGGLDVRVDRNHFGAQIESFEADLILPFLAHARNRADETTNEPFRGIFIRAPVVEKTLPPDNGKQIKQQNYPDTVVAPSRSPNEAVSASVLGGEVEVLAKLPGRRERSKVPAKDVGPYPEEDIIAVRQGNVLATAFHPELSGDARIHIWWLRQISKASGLSD